jgi:hypothetical protein
MDRNTRRLLLVVATCSLTGIVLGGTASRAQIHQCQMSQSPSSECLTTDHTTKVIEGMGAGLVAGAGAAIGVTWQAWQHKDD